MKIEKINITLFFVNIFVAILLCVGFGFQIRSFHVCRSAIEQYRVREQQYEDTIRQLTETVELQQRDINECRATIETAKTISNELGGSIQRQYSSIQQLRKVLHEVRVNYKKMEDCLYSGSRVYSNISNSGVSEVSE